MGRSSWRGIFLERGDLRRGGDVPERYSPRRREPTTTPPRTLSNVRNSRALKTNTTRGRHREPSTQALHACRSQRPSEDGREILLAGEVAHGSSAAANLRDPFSVM